MTVNETQTPCMTYTNVFLHPLLDDTNWPDLQGRADLLMAELIGRGRRCQRLPDDLTVGDIVFATIRFGRPLAIGLAPAEDRAIAHCQLDRYVDGLCTPDPAAQ